MSRFSASGFSPTESADETPLPFWEQFLPNSCALAVARALQLGGPLLSPVAACATGLICLQRGCELIRDGMADVVIAGSSDASLVPSVSHSFRRMGVLAKSQEGMMPRCRPFDRNRNGFVIGEGAAIFVLENLTVARQRGARIYAEWLGGGLASEGDTLTALPDDGIALGHLIRQILQQSALTPEDIDYINLHGTGTVQNDIYETEALKKGLGQQARRVPCSSLKGALGHLLGAAGSVETAFTLLALRDGIIPPTVNLETPDPHCDLDYTPCFARPAQVQTALKLSLGFGGHLAAAVLRKL